MHSLRLRIASDMFSADINVWHCSLSIDFFKHVLNCLSICHLVKLIDLSFNTLLLKQFLCRTSEWAVALRVDQHTMFPDIALNLRFEITRVDHLSLKFSFKFPC